MILPTKRPVDSDEYDSVIWKNVSLCPVALQHFSPSFYYCYVLSLEGIGLAPIKIHYIQRFTIKIDLAKKFIQKKAKFLSKY
uniref:Uncharacterized protein n=1 Tax=Megaselia scalaris TaxID=36166 RepID=T1GKM9_MEGSC